MLKCKLFRQLLFKEQNPTHGAQLKLNVNLIRLKMFSPVAWVIYICKGYCKASIELREQCFWQDGIFTFATPSGL